MTVDTHEMTEADVRGVVDREARRRLGVSGTEFIRLVVNGDHDTVCAHGDLRGLVRLLPEGGF